VFFEGPSFVTHPRVFRSSAIISQRSIHIAAISAFLAVALGAMASDRAVAAEGIVLGDSIGEGISQINGIKSVARRSISLRRSDISPQLAQIPKGAVALLSLGANDAYDPVEHLRPAIERVIEKAEKTGEKFVWVGPPCVLTAWDQRFKAVDEYLRTRLAKTTIQYVSLRDPQICHPAMRTRDGAHFTAAGYRYLWQKIRLESTYGALVEAPPARPVLVTASVTAKPHVRKQAPPRRRYVRQYD
jgi:lysophospholipase L1-like esterase